ncbi:MAG: hypothetical protein LBQ81_10695 [Zoogloeaceae bacterium]|nr:hypothetical protein [Zoogloeaceae bacterium]
MSAREVNRLEVVIQVAMGLPGQRKAGERLALSRRLNRDDEINPKHAETMIQLVMIHLLLKRLSNF